MTITHIILGSLNILVAGVMLWFAAQSAYARAQWNNYMRQYEEMRDGRNKGLWIQSLDERQRNLLRTRVVIDESILYALPADQKAQIMNQLRGAVEAADEKPASEERIRQEITRLFGWNTGQRSVVTKRGDKREYQVNNDPA